MDFREPFEVKQGQTLHWRIGPLGIWIYRSDVELCVCSEEYHGDAPEQVCAEPANAPEDARWHRWNLEGMDGVFALRPVMPDRPVVVRPEAELSFCSRSEGVFFARIPFFVALYPCPDASGEPLCEIPTRTMSNTWFGPDTTRGELCYGMRTSARRSLEGVEPAGHLVICPIRLQNSSDEILDFERLSIRTEHLSIFSYKDRLWSSRIEMVFRGHKKNDQIKYNDAWFEVPEEAAVLSERRTPVVEKPFRLSLGGFRPLKNML